MRLTVLLLAPFVLLACQSKPATPSGPVFTIEGAVARPGEQRWSEDLTAIEALALAGPVDANADLARVELVRVIDGGVQRSELDLARVQESGDSTFNVLVRPGDVLRVPVH